MATSYMLSVDKKRTDKVSFEKPLSKWIEKEESYKVADFQEALNELDKLREDVRNAVEKSENTLPIHYRYYGLLSSLERRIPISEKDVRIQFTWYDVYKNKKVGLYNVRYERANVLFNTAAFMSQIAAAQNRNTDEGIKLAGKYFQLASGAFLNLKEEELEHSPAAAAGNDLTGISLLMLSNLMLAQAQECVLEKAIKGNMKAGVLSKLAAQVAEYYEVTNNLITTTELKNVVPKKYSSYCELKLNMFKAIAHYEDARDLATEELFGQQIGRLRTAYSLLIACQTAKLTKNVPEMAEYFTMNLSKIQVALQKAEKDNDEIYHDMVIPESKLKPLEKKSMVKSMPLEREKFGLVVDPFVNLVPTGARKADSLYCEKQAELLREINKEIEQQNDTAKGALTALGLPGAIEAMETPIGIPSSLLERLRVVKLEGGVNFLREQLKLLDKLAQQAQIALSESTKLLDEEEREDNDFRNQYKNKWNRTPSHMLTDQLRGEAQKHQGNLDHARKSDRFIASKLESGAEFLQRLSWEKEQISGLLPTADLLSGTTPTLNVSVLKERLSQLDTLLFEREQKLSQLKEISTKDDILDKIIRTPENEFEALFNQELQKYSHLTTQIRGTFTTQASLLIDITNENQKLVEQRKSNMDLAKRQEVLSQFDNAFSIYNQLKFHLTEGAQFYVDFQEALKKYRSKCQDFIFARRTEKDDLLGDIKAQEATAQIQSTNAASSLGTSSVMSQSTSLSSSVTSQPVQQSQPTAQMPVYYHAPGSQQAPPYPAPVGIAPSGPFSVPMSMLQQPTPQQQPQQMIYGQYHYPSQPAYYIANPYMMQQQQPQQPPQYQPPRK